MILTGSLLFPCGLLCPMAEVRADEADEERLLEGLSEDEKRQFLNDIYSDMNKEQNPGVPTAGMLSGSGSSMTDEEAEEAIREMLPDQETLEEFANEARNRVMDFASFRRGYDKARGLYEYTFLNGGGIALSVPLGGWSDHAVSLLPMDGVSITSICRDGETLDQKPGEDGAYFFRETGRYSFQANGGSNAFLGYFRIVSPKVPVKESFLWSPEGYRLTEVKLKGEDLPAGDGKWLALKDDGFYELTYTAVEGTGLPENWTLMFLRDTTAPVIEWDGEIRNGRFFGSVTYRVDDPEAVVAMWHNGRPAYTETGTIAAPGSYYVTATDPSGNMRSWQFVVEHRDEFPWMIAGIAMGVILLSLLMMLLTARLGMRIR